jgi:hypothetical protein
MNRTPIGTKAQSCREYQFWSACSALPFASTSHDTKPFLRLGKKLPASPATARTSLQAYKTALYYGNQDLGTRIAAIRSAQTPIVASSNCYPRLGHEPVLPKYWQWSLSWYLPVIMVIMLSIQTQLCDYWFPPRTFLRLCSATTAACVNLEKAL